MRHALFSRALFSFAISGHLSVASPTRMSHDRPSASSCPTPCSARASEISPNVYFTPMEHSPRTVSYPSTCCSPSGEITPSHPRVLQSPRDEIRSNSERLKLSQDYLLSHYVRSGSFAFAVDPSTPQQEQDISATSTPPMARSTPPTMWPPQRQKIARQDSRTHQAEKKKKCARIRHYCAKCRLKRGKKVPSLSRPQPTTRSKPNYRSHDSHEHSRWHSSSSDEEFEGRHRSSGDTSAVSNTNNTDGICCCCCCGEPADCDVGEFLSEFRQACSEDCSECCNCSGVSFDDCVEVCGKILKLICVDVFCCLCEGIVKAEAKDKQFTRGISFLQ